MGKQDRKSAARAISDTAQKIWLAGLGAFAKAQQEGSRVFDQLIDEGTQLDERTRNYTKDQLDQLRGQMEDTAERLRQSGLASMERIQALIDQRVAEAIERMAVPSRSDFDRLAGQIAAMAGQFAGTGAAAARGATDVAAAANADVVAGARAGTGAGGRRAKDPGTQRPRAGASDATSGAPSSSDRLTATRGKMRASGALATSRRAPSGALPRPGAAAKAATSGKAAAASKPGGQAMAGAAQAAPGGTKAGAGKVSGGRHATAAVETTAAGKPARPPKKTSRR